MSKDSSYSEKLRILWEKRVQSYLDNHEASLQKLSQTQCEILLWDVTRTTELRHFRQRYHIVDQDILNHTARESTIGDNTTLCLKGKRLFRTERLAKFQEEWRLPHTFADFLQSHKALFTASILEYRLHQITPPLGGAITIDDIVTTLCTASAKLPPILEELLDFTYTFGAQTRLEIWYTQLYNYAKVNVDLTPPPNYPFQEVLTFIHSQYPLSIIGKESYKPLHESLMRVHRGTTPIILGPTLESQLAALEQEHRKQLFDFQQCTLFKAMAIKHLESTTHGLGKIALLDVEAFIAQHSSLSEPSNPQSENSPALLRRKRENSSSPELRSSSPSPSTSLSTTPISIPSSSGSSSPSTSEKRGGWTRQLSKKFSKVFTRSSSPSLSSTPEPQAPQPLARQTRSSTEDTVSTSSETADTPSPTLSIRSKRFSNYRQSIQISSRDELAESSEEDITDSKENGHISRLQNAPGNAPSSPPL